MNKYFDFNHETYINNVMDHYMWCQISLRQLYQTLHSHTFQILRGGMLVLFWEIVQFMRFPIDSLTISTQTGIILKFNFLYQRNCMVSEGRCECLYKLIRLSEGTSTIKVVLLDCNVWVQAITAATARPELGTLENRNSNPDHWVTITLNYLFLTA